MKSNRILLHISHPAHVHLLRNFINNTKNNNEIYVFTRDGDLKVVPSSASALDLAYDIHTDIGNKCLGAKVNHRIVPLNCQPWDYQKD